MCGIAGFLGSNENNDAERMLAALSHRGPDDKGIYSDSNITLAHARLSVIDVSKDGHQPMFNSEKSVAVVFNGEIYNYKELKAHVNKEYRFKGNSDTEVILALYEEKGEACFSYFSGMFSIGIYDFKLQKLILARDRFGKKPLYYTSEKNTFVFASEIKAMMKHSKVKKELDLESINSYLFYDYIPTPQTILKNVYKLEPATYLVYEKNTVRKQCYWQLEAKPFEGTFNEAKNELSHLIEKSVEKRLVSDVPLGVFLSGGLDSSTVAYYAQKNSEKKIKTFAVGFEEKTFDESRYAREVAQFLNTDHHSFLVKSKDIKDCLEDIGNLVDEPLADASIVPTYLLSKNTKECVTVALGGDGGDELFAGYPTFQAQKLLGLYNTLPQFLKRNIIEPLIHQLPVEHTNFSLGFKLNKFIEGGTLPLPHIHQNWLGSFQEKDREALFTPDYWQKLKSFNVYKHIDSYYKELSGSEENKILYSYVRTYLLDAVLVKVDRASMWASLEARSPLLDEALAEFAFSLPYHFKMHGFTSKYILKKLMADKLPNTIVHRKKKGFGLPIGAWLKHDLNSFMNNVLDEVKIQKQGIFNSAYIKKLKTEHTLGLKDHRKKLWNLIVLELWRQAHDL